MRHSVSLTRPDSRNSWADANTSALKPNELMSLCADFRVEASSSTIETRGLSAALTFTFIEPNILAPEAESILLDLDQGNHDLWPGSPRCSAMRTRSARDFASILCMM